MRRKLTIVALVGILAVAIFLGREHDVHVSKEMTWQCLPSADLPAFPGAQSVVFRFRENPHYVMLDSGEHLCDQLKASGRQIINVDFDIFGSYLTGYRGFRTDAFDGKPLVKEGWASSGANSKGPDDPIGADPLARYFKLFP